MAGSSYCTSVEKSVSIDSGRGAFVRLPLKKKWDPGSGYGGRLGMFVIKTIALEAVRRVSKAKFPFFWTALQRLQVLCFPPLKWVQRWNPLSFLVKGMQALSRPLLVVSLVDIFSDQPDAITNVSGEYENSPISGGTETLNTRVDDASTQDLVSTEELNRLYKELEKQGFALPDRITKEDLHRHYVNANGDFPSWLSLVKKTIRWRETYRFLSMQELDSWSKYIFWHGTDVKFRHCLFVRLGLGCSQIPPLDRALFTKALISQVEYGILNLMDEANPRITVLVDCQGVSPLRFPMQTMGYCCSILKDHFPDVLGCLIIVHAPPVVRVIANTFIKVLKPSTRKKLRMEGDSYHKLLSGLFETLPAYLGGSCTCSICVKLNSEVSTRIPEVQKHLSESSGSDSMESYELRSVQPLYRYESIVDSEYNRTIRAAIIGILSFLVFAALLEGIYNPETRPSSNT